MGPSDAQSHFFPGSRDLTELDSSATGQVRLKVEKDGVKNFASRFLLCSGETLASFAYSPRCRGSRRGGSINKASSNAEPISVNEELPPGRDFSRDTTMILASSTSSPFTLRRRWNVLGISIAMLIRTNYGTGFCQGAQVALVPDYVA